MVFVNFVFVFANFELNILQVEKIVFVNLVIGWVRAFRPIFFVNFVFVFVNFKHFAGGGNGEEVATGGERWSRGEEDWREEVRRHGGCHFVELQLL